MEILTGSNNLTIKKAVGLLTVLLSTLVLASCSSGESSNTSAESGSTSISDVKGAHWIAGWRETSSLSGPRAGAATIVVNGYMYVIGGVDGVGFVRTSEFATEVLVRGSKQLLCSKSGDL